MLLFLTIDKMRITQGNLTYFFVIINRRIKFLIELIFYDSRLSTPSKTRRIHKIIGSLPEICRALDKIKLNKLDAKSYNKIMMVNF